MAKKFYLVKNTRHETSAGGFYFTFAPCYWCPSQHSFWGIFSTEDAKQQEALATLKAVEEISAEDYAIYKKQQESLRNPSNVVSFSARGKSEDIQNFVEESAVQVDKVPATPAIVETAEEVLETKTAKAAKK